MPRVVGVQEFVDDFMGEVIRIRDIEQPYHVVLIGVPPERAFVQGFSWQSDAQDAVRRKNAQAEALGIAACYEMSINAMPVPFAKGNI
jgi:hypothetical protein